MLDGRVVTEMTAHERNIAMVFQSYALYPHLTVAQNVALPLTMRHLTALGRLPGVGRFYPGAAGARSDIRRKVEQVAESLEISALLNRKPAQISGGQRQRVALARALVRDPVLFLLDEPLSNLDARLRVQTRAELVNLHKRTGRAFIYVTHDQAEAMAMSDQVIVMMDGAIAQVGSPRDLYERPASCAVAAFVGAHQINFLPANSLGDGVLPGTAGKTIGLRPEHLVPTVDGQIQVHLESAEYLGSEIILTARNSKGEIIRSIAPGNYNLPAPNSEIRLGFETTAAHIFDPDTGLRSRGAI